MEISIKKRAMVFSGTSNPELAKEIADHLGMNLTEVQLTRFASSEVKARFPESVRGVDAFVVQTHCAPVNEMIMEQLIMIDALKRASAKRINAVIPFFGYARQDRKALAREPITARLVADLLEVAGADRVLTVDLHTGQIQGFFDIPVDHLTAVPLIADYIADKYVDNLVVVAPDANGATLAAKYAHHLGADLGILEKRRIADQPNVTETVGLVGEVEGKCCLIVDDMIDTGGSLVGGANLLLERGASKVIAASTHAVFSPPALDRLRDSPIQEIVVTNTLPIPAEARSDQISVLSIAPSLAATIKAVFEDESVSEIFQGEHLDYIPPEYQRRGADS
jgi:ribose-phosphate pyrophosphokinase